MKKLVSLMLAVILIFSLSACKNNKSESDKNANKPTDNNETSSDFIIPTDDELEDDGEISTPVVPNSNNSSTNNKTSQSHTHTWQAATCTAPKTCSVCKATEGEVAEHKYSDGKCEYCGEAEKKEKPENETYSDYINYRGYNTDLSDKKYAGALSNTYKKLTSKKELNVVYFGGSVTYGYGSEDSDQKGSWRCRVGEWLKTTFPKVKINNYNCAIGDTGTNLGNYRLERDVISKKPDLLFIEFSINDYYEGLTYIESSTQFETIIRRVKEELPECDIVTILVTDRNEVSAARTTVNDKGESKAGELHLQAKAHEYISKKYNISSIHVGRALADEIFTAGNGNYSAEIWQQYVKDGVHPKNKGYDVYFRVIKEFLSNSLLNSEIKDCEIIKQKLPKAVNLQLINGDVTFIDDGDVKITTKNGATHSPKAEGLSDRWEEGGYKGIINFPSGSTDTVTVKFKGTELVMVVTSGLSENNVFEVSIDDGKTWSLCNYSSKNPTTVLKGLPEKEYTAIIRPAYNSDISIDCFYSRNAKK